jgi:hypothetical protein
MELKELNTEQLTEKLELFRNRIETVTDYISDADDSDVKNQLQIQYSQYQNAVKLIKSEIRNREVLEKIYNAEIDTDAILNKLKTVILEKLKAELPRTRHEYSLIHNAQNLQTVIDDLKLNNRRYYHHKILNSELLGLIPDGILIENQIYLNKENITQTTGTALFFSSNSKHYKDSESFHYGDCKSEHFENSESNHMDSSKSIHTDNCRSVHRNNSSSVHSGNSKSQHVDNASYEGIKNGL